MTNGIIPLFVHSLRSPSATKFEGTSNDIVGIPFASFVTGELVTPGAPTLPAASTQTTA